MVTILPTKSIYFTDFNIIPGGGDGKAVSRNDVDTEMYRCVVSPMVSVVGETFTIEAAKLGLSLTTPRFLPTEQKIKLYSVFESNKISSKQLCFISISLKEKDDDIRQISKSGCQNLLFDLANGYLPTLANHVNRVYNLTKIRKLMIGNVVSDTGLANLSKLSDFCDELFCRIGIGNGSQCSSSDCASINRGQASELIECSAEKDHFNKINKLLGLNKRLFIGSDGGLSKPAFIVKAFGCGADFVMIGGMFAKAREAETHVSGDGKYWGCASLLQNKLAGLDNKPVEGKITQIDKNELKPLKDIVKEIKDGIASGLTYCRYDSVSDFIGNAVIELKYSPLPPKNRK